MQFIEKYFHFIALLILLSTSVIFVTFLLMAHKKENLLFKKLHLAGLIIITIYEIFHVILLIYTAHNVILRIYTCFLGVSLGMLVYVEIVYLIHTFKNKTKQEI